MKWKYNDGGRSKYFKGSAGDCVTRAVAIAEGRDYKEVYDELFDFLGHSPRDGVSPKDTRRYLEHLGWTWTPTMKIGQGCTVHLREDELPDVDVLIARVTKHITPIINGTIYDTYDPSRDGTRCVYGYWTKD